MLLVRRLGFGRRLLAQPDHAEASDEEREDGGQHARQDVPVELAAQEGEPPRERGRWAGAWSLRLFLAGGEMGPAPLGTGPISGCLG